MKHNSPYTAAITGCSFLFYEFKRMLPLMMHEDSERLLKEEIEANEILMVNARKSRTTFVCEFKRRFNSLPIHFWKEWLVWSEPAQRVGLLYAILKTYKLVFDFHLNIAIRKWNSIDHTLLKSDLLMEFNEIAANDEFVDSWSDNTRNRCASAYLSILRQAGLMEKDELQPIHLDAEDYVYYIRTGEDWFLEACLLYPYEINNIKSQLQ